MKELRIFFMITMVLLLSMPNAIAGDFDWVKDFNLTAQADPSGFRARLATRFQIGDVKINTVIGNCENPADAYMVLRLGELSKQPPEVVLKEYKANKGKGWGVMAKNLGIKPGSSEFHALKRGHDLKGHEKGKMDKEKGGKEKGGKGKGKKK